MAFGTPYFGNQYFGGQYFGHQGGIVTATSAGSPPLLGTIMFRVLLHEDATITVSPAIAGTIDMNGVSL